MRNEDNHDFDYDGQRHENGAQLFDSYESAIRASERTFPSPFLDGPSLLGGLRGFGAWSPDRQTVLMASGLFVLGAALIGTSIYLRRR